MEVISYIFQGLSLLSSFGVIYMTYRVYNMNHLNTQIDNFLKQIIILYYKIVDDGKIIKSTQKKTSNEELLAQCYRRIEINAALMGYYVKMYPKHYKNKEEFEKVVNSLSHSPNIEKDYDKLGDEFKKFCQNICDVN